MAEPDRGTPAPVPRWVKVVGLVIVLLLLVLGIVLILGEHGPGRHAPSGAGPVEPAGGS